MTAAARSRYLDVLGFRPRPTADSEEGPNDPPQTTTAPSLQPPEQAAAEAFTRLNTPARPDAVRGESASPDPGKTAGFEADSRPGSTDYSRRSTHFAWLATDREWEREQPTNKSDDLAPSSDHPHTLAGTVAIETDNELEAAWARYKRHEKQADRDELIVYYAPLVKYVASRIAAGLPQTVDQSDLVSYGMFGLIDAITKFDPERGFKFETYAISRICLLYTSPSPRDRG